MRATASRVHDQDAVGELIKLDYVIPPGTAAGIYAKAFPGGLRPDQIDVARLAVKATEPDEAAQVTAAMEIKGTAGVQRVPLEIRSDGIPDEQLINWPVIGEVKEVVLLVNSIPGQVEPATGSLLIDARFENLPMLRKWSLSTAVRFAGVLVSALLAALVTVLLQVVVGRRSDGDSSSETLSQWAPQARTGHWHHFLDDLVRGIGVVLIALLAIEAFELGSRNILETGWIAVGIALAGGALAEWWKAGLTGRHLTGREAFQDTFASGLLATSSSALAILQAPASWSEMVFLSQTAAAARSWSIMRPMLIGWLLRAGIWDRRLLH